MKLRSFQIKNYKGVKETTINVSDEVPGNVITLIGLNESGKTTILEALSHFVTDDAATASLVSTVHKKPSLQELIPKDQKAAFTGAVSILANVELEDDDVEGLAEFFKEKHKLKLQKDKLKRVFTVEKAYHFEDSALGKSQQYWNARFPLMGTSRTAKSVKEYSGLTATRDVWLSGLDFLKSRIPNIVYFPTLLFNFPDRIYLEDGHIKEPFGYYREVIQDLLNALGGGLDIKRHIVDRISKHREKADDQANFATKFMGFDEKGQIDAVVQRISNEMSSVIFGAWGEILGKRIANKRVQVEWALDAEDGNTPYLQVTIIDGQSKYALSERSLGFRWFFSFLLFTQFRRGRTSHEATIFLFDEPAANLHSRAQLRLLKSFSKIAANGTYIIYSTHSHYMIDPLWLEKAYIISNSALDYDSDEDIDSFAARKTDIVATKYRNFVFENPTRTTYFQPVLDALDVGPTSLEIRSKAIILEGKHDFPVFNYFSQKLKIIDLPNSIPAQGAGNMELLVGLMRGWGVQFIVLLDDDKAGRDAKAKYQKELLLTDREVLTIGDLLPKDAGKSFDQLVEDDARAVIQTKIGTGKLDKRNIALFFIGYASEPSPASFQKTEAKFAALFEPLAQLFKL